MAFVQPDILPAMAEAIHRQIIGTRGNRLSKESLAARVVPNGLSKGVGGAKYFADTLRELEGIGVVRIEDGQVSLSENNSTAGASGAMAAIVRTRVMQAELENDLWKKDAAGSLLLVGARDLVRSLAWFMSLNVLNGPYTYDGAANPVSQLQEDQTGERPIFNDSRWPPFVRWARYLGFVRDIPLYSKAGKLQPGVLPDPTDAVAAVLPRCVSGKDWVPLSVFLPALAAELPVLDGGTYRRAIHERVAPVSDTNVSPTLTLALERLRARGDIELDVGAGDAEKVVFANNRGAYHALRLALGSR